MDLVFSTTDSVWANRMSHGVKISLSAVIGHVALRQLGLSARSLVGTLVLSDLSYALPCAVYDSRSLINRNHGVGAYNRLLNRIWGPPATPRARLQFPLVTGLELALIYHLLKKSGLNLGTASLVVSMGYRARALWEPLSFPSGFVDDGTNCPWNWLPHGSAQAAMRGAIQLENFG